MLEDHIVPFVKKWKLGCGFYGEQGETSFKEKSFDRGPFLKWSSAYLEYKDFCTSPSVLST